MPFDDDGRSEDRGSHEPSASLTNVTVRKARRGAGRRSAAVDAARQSAATDVAQRSAATDAARTTPPPPPSPSRTVSTPAADAVDRDLAIPTPQPVRPRPGGAIGRAPFSARAYLPNGGDAAAPAPDRPPGDRGPSASGRRVTPPTPIRPSADGPTANGPTAALRPRPPGLLATRWSEARARLGRMPGLLFVDQNDIAGQWPNSLVMAVKADRGRLSVAPLHRYPPVPGSGVAAVEFDTTVVQWVCDTAREAVRLGKAVQDSEAVHTSQGWVRLGCLALPLSSDNRLIDRVLCHLYPA